MVLPKTLLFYKNVFKCPKNAFKSSKTMSRGGRKAWSLKLSKFIWTSNKSLIIYAYLKFRPTSRFSILCVLFLKHGPLTIIMLVLLLLFFLLFHLFCLFVLCFFSCDLIRQPEVLSINSYKAIQVEFAANGNLWVWFL